ncbi:MAG: hypothetical protein ACQEV0_02145 [Bacillota bacterium]
MEFLEGINGITIAVIIFGIFLLLTGLIVGSILMALKKSKSQKVDDLPHKHTADSSESERASEVEKKETDSENKL